MSNPATRTRAAARAPRLTNLEVLDVLEPFVEALWKHADDAFAAVRAASNVITKHSFTLPTQQSRVVYTELLRQAVLEAVPGAQRHAPKPNLIVVANGGVQFFRRCRAILDSGRPWVSQSTASCRETHQLGELPLVTLGYRITVVGDALARLVLLYPKDEQEVHWEHELLRAPSANTRATMASSTAQDSADSSQFAVKQPPAETAKQTSDRE